MNYAVVDKHSNRAIAIIGKDFKAYFEVYFSIFDIIEIDSIGNTNFNLEGEIIEMISIYPTKKPLSLSRDAYYMIRKASESINIKKAYEAINNTNK